MIPNKFEDIDLEDLGKLIEEGRQEDRTIEYKSKIPSNAESEKIPQLLKPVCSFANTDGGDLVFGMRAHQGIAKELLGVEIDNTDQKKLMLEQMIQNGLEPQLRGVQIKAMPFGDEKYILVIRVPKSWTSPHRLKVNAKFYARNSAGAFELDIPQIRQAFLLSNTVAQNMKEFRASRIATLLGEDPPVPLRDGVRTVFHLIPLSSFASMRMLSVNEYQDLFLRLFPFGSGTIDYHLNFEGMITMSGTEEMGFRAYTQLFRSGIIEYVRVYEPHNGEKYIPSVMYEQALLHSYRGGISLLKDLGFEPPIYVFLTFVGAKGYRLGVSRELVFSIDQPQPFNRDILTIPNSELKSFEDNEIKIMKPLFDIVWNAGGYPGSLNFNENDEWQPRR